MELLSPDKVQKLLSAGVICCIREQDLFEQSISNNQDGRLDNVYLNPLQILSALA